MSYKIPNFNLPDFSALTETARRIEEAIRPVRESLQRISEVIQPVIIALESYKPKIEAGMQVFAKAMRNMDAVRKMGEAQFVCWDYMSADLAEQLIVSKNTNKILREYLVKEKFKSVDKTIALCQSSPLLTKHLRLFNQAVSAFKRGENDIAVNAFTSVFDGILSKVSGMNTHKLAKRIDVVLEKLNSDELLDNDEYAILTFAITFQKTIESFSTFVSFDKKEPKGLNRNWIAHGRSLRKKTKLDCVKLINLIYGLILINELDAKSAN